MDRRTFLTQATVLAALSGVAIKVTGCSSDSSPTGTGTPSVDGSVDGSGHSHNVTLSGAQIDAGAMVTLSVTGGGHTHAVTLTAQEVMDIGNGQPVDKPIDEPASHPHTVHFN